MDFSFVGAGSPQKRPAPASSSGGGADAQKSKQPRMREPQPEGQSAAFRFMGSGLARQSRPSRPAPAAVSSRPASLTPTPPAGGAVRSAPEQPLRAQPPAQPRPPQQHQPQGSGAAEVPGPEVAAPAAAAVALAPPPNTILVAPRQQGNPLLRHIRNVRWTMMAPGTASPTGPDYLLGEAAAALFLSLRYHLLHPEYIHARIRGLAPASFKHRVLLVHADTDDCVRPLEAVTKAALRNGLTVLLAWSPEEAARWLETLKAYESKPADAIQERVDADYLSRLTAALTTVKGVNRTDVTTLGRRFGTFASVASASMEELSACAGLGPTKVARLHDAFHKPFRKQLRFDPATLGRTAPQPGSLSHAAPRRP